MGELVVVGIDPGKLRGTGLACCRLDGSHRQLWDDWSGVADAREIAGTVSEWLDPEVLGARQFVAIETMQAMGPTTGLQKQFDNSQFVGELVGRLEERGHRVVQLKKNEILRALGLRGKAKATRVRAVAESLFRNLGPVSDHVVDAAVAAFVGSMKGAPAHGV